MHYDKKPLPSYSSIQSPEIDSIGYSPLRKLKVADLGISWAPALMTIGSDNSS
jgi:hypothetical protein